MSGTYLLDANVLIALVVTDHEHHHRASRWFTTVDRVGITPTIEGALVRFTVRMGAGRDAATTVLSGMYATERCEFWPDTLSYTHADLTHVIGHRQVTDAYLAATAAAHGARLATFDEELARTNVGTVHLVT